MSNNNLALVFLSVPMLCYVAQAMQYAIQQNRYGLALSFAAYAVANVGFILDMKGI